MQLATPETSGQEAGERTIPKSFRHQPALDGLRGLAVAAVLVHHQGFRAGWGRGGFLGVDVFFVLSGFLITSLLLIDHANTGHVVSWQFWARRARRLFPPLLLLLVGVSAYALIIAKPYQMDTIRGDVFASLFYVYNFWLLNPAHNYAPWLLSHTWSLSIEEQFYFVWPLVLAVLVRISRGRKGWLIAMIASLAAASAGLMAFVYKTPDFTRANAGTDTRSQALFIGCALGVALLGWSGPVSRRARIALEVAGILAFLLLLRLIAEVEFYHSAWLYHGGFALVAVASATVIAAAVQPASPVLRRVLSVRPLIAIGIISYGLYLYHWPIYVWLDADRVGLTGIPLFLVRIAVTSSVAMASYFFVERPIRRGVFSWRRLGVIAPVATVSVIALVLVATLGNEPITASVLGEIFYSETAASTPPGSARVLVAGDAAAFRLGVSINGAFNGAGIVGVTTAVLDCSIESGSVVIGRSVRAQADCRDWPSVFKTAVDTFRPDVSVLMVGTGASFDRVVDGRRLRAGTPEFTTYLLHQLEQVRGILTAKGARLVLLTTPCSYSPQATASTRDPNRGRVEWLNSVFRTFAAQHSSVQVSDYANYICQGAVPRTLLEHQPPRWTNGAPLGPAGALASWNWIAPVALAAEHGPRNDNP